MQNVKSK